MPIEETSVFPELALDKIDCGICAQITHVQAAADICRRLQEMGICQSNTIRKIADHGAGAVVCEVGQSRLVISSALLQKIFVKELPP